jgi:hypothetical protein
MHMKIVFYMVIDGSTSMIKHTHTPRIFIMMETERERELNGKKSAELTSLTAVNVTQCRYDDVKRWRRGWWKDKMSLKVIDVC